VREMFTSIAPRYDLLNHVLSFNIDRVWWNRTARAFRHILSRQNARILDLCCGTGDMTFALRRAAAPTARILGADFSHAMLQRVFMSGLFAAILFNAPAFAITAQEAWEKRDGYRLTVPKFVREVVERVAFAAREDKKIDKRSGVSQRLPISCMENVISNAERRALRHGEELIVPRVGDIYAAMPSITGKLELEYEGEMKGADNVARELIRAAVAKTFDPYLANADLQPIVQWFDLGGDIKMSDTVPADEVAANLRKIQGLLEKLEPLGVKPKDRPEVLVSAAEFLLEGLHAHKRIGRSEERVFSAGEKQARRAEPQPLRERDEERPNRNRRPYN